MKIYFSLTEGKCLSNSRDLVDESGYLKFSGKDLFWMYLTGKLNNDLLNQIYDEFHSQFDLLSKYCEIQHISSHEHVHIIPPIFDYLFNFSKSKKINLRYFNEDFFTFYNFNDLNNFIYDLNFLKFFLISFLSRFSNKYELSSYKSYGIKFSGKINYINLSKYFKSLNFSEKVNIYFHPGYKSITEEKNLNLKKYDYKFINSFDRQKELNSIVDFYNKN